MTDKEFNFKVIDLTHTLHSDVPNWDEDCGFKLSTEVDYKDCVPPYLFRVNRIEMRLSTGTHMDAPAHCFPNAKTIAELDMENLVTDCVVIDVSSVANENYMVMPEVVENFEKEHGKIKENSFVILYTGWAKYWEDKEKYINSHKFPSVHEETAKLFVERGVAGIGIDTLSPDAGKDSFPVHSVILGAGKYLVENIANAKSLPPVGSKILVLPMKIKDATEAPVRLVALV